MICLASIGASLYFTPYIVIMIALSRLLLSSNGNTIWALHLLTMLGGRLLLSHIPLPTVLTIGSSIKNQSIIGISNIGISAYKLSKFYPSKSDLCWHECGEIGSLFSYGNASPYDPSGTESSK